ncbi:hypothetical protein FRX31_018808 [Thalictrum thalictroides]|uniref:Uncharacterized protein n=1 Tax=Thalictrum thalictroides TaxID=46969 RepID=A0A7J6W2K7_THATH|nr:hypothetical protein FRX31_018808 [Thalictrum thalictroides]
MPSACCGRTATKDADVCPWLVRLSVAASGAAVGCGALSGQTKLSRRAAPVAVRRLFLVIQKRRTATLRLVEFSVHSETESRPRPHGLGGLGSSGTETDLRIDQRVSGKPWNPTQKN